MRFHRISQQFRISSIFEEITVMNGFPLFVLLSSGVIQAQNYSYQQLLNVSNPFVYTKLRPDKYFMPVSRAFLHSSHHHEESKLNIKYTDFYHGNRSRSITQEFYVNERRQVQKIGEDELIFEALDQIYRSSFIRFYRQDFDQPSDALKASEIELISSKRCDRELDYLVSKLETIQWYHQRNLPLRGLNPEIMALFDSFGAPEPGLLMGNYNWLGHWRECTQRAIFELSPTEGIIDFRPRYCLAKLRAPSWAQMAAAKLSNRSDSWGLSLYEGQQEAYLSHHRIQLGMCLPQSCDSDVWLRKPEVLGKLLAWRLGELYTQYTLAGLYCLPDEQSELRQLDTSSRLLLNFSLAWLTLVTVSSLCRYLNLIDAETNKRDPIAKLIKAFSLQESLKNLTKLNSLSRSREHNKNTEATETRIISSQPQSSDLLYFEFFKVMIMLGLLYLHVFTYDHQMGEYTLDWDTASGYMLFYWQETLIFYVDWCFCMTGFMASYLSFAKGIPGRNNLKDWIYFLFHRYWRLAPCYVVYFWFLRSGFMHTGSGPLWDYGTSEHGHRATCRKEPWIVPIALVSNWRLISRECVMSSWYISAEWQYYLLTPLSLLILWKKPIFGWILHILVIIGALVARLWAFSQPQYQNEHVDFLRPRPDVMMLMMDHMGHVYTQSHFRWPSYLVGILAGHYAYQIKSGQWQPLLRWLPNWLLFCAGASLTLFISFGTIIIDLIIPRSFDKHAHLFEPIPLANSHFSMALAAAWMLLALLTIKTGSRASKVFNPLSWLRRHLLDRPIWPLLSRLNYFVYLCQIDFIIWMRTNGAGNEPRLSQLEMFKLFVLLAPLLYAFSFLATVLLANPLAQLEATFLGVHMASHKTPAKEASGPHHKSHLSTKNFGELRPQDDKGQEKDARL